MNKKTIEVNLSQHTLIEGLLIRSGARTLIERNQPFIIEGIKIKLTDDLANIGDHTVYKGLLWKVTYASGFGSARKYKLERKTYREVTHAEGIPLYKAIDLEVGVLV